jgi:hypothetical protein
MLDFWTLPFCMWISGVPVYHFSAWLWWRLTVKHSGAPAPKWSAAFSASWYTLTGCVTTQLLLGRW